MSEAPVEQRIGDRERHAVDERLQAAVGDGVLTLAEYEERSAQLWQARTRVQLEALVADLPAPVAPSRPVATTRTAPHRVIAVMSEDRLSGALLPGQEVAGWAVMGKAVLDLRRADLPDGVRVRVRSLMGEVEVQVPPGSQVLLSGLALMGERKVRVAPGDGPVVHVDAYALMGSIHVTVGDGQVLPAGRAAAVPWQPTSPARSPVPAPSRSSALQRLRRRIGGALVPLVLLGGAAGVLASGEDARALFGSSVERVQPGDSSVEVSVLFGGVSVVVPDDARVDTSGLVMFGSTSCTDACDADGSGEVVTVRAVGGFGSVVVYTESEHAELKSTGMIDD